MPEDVFHLTPEEAAAALESRHPLTDVRDSALRQRDGRRRGRGRRAARHTGLGGTRHRHRTHHHSEADFHVLEPGDIAVCPGTRPSWSVIFP